MRSVIGGFLLLGIWIVLIIIYQALTKPETPKYTGQKRICPRCRSCRFHAFVEEQVVIPAKVKSKTTLNMNPLKPFTVYDHQEKVVRQQVTKQVTKFVCDDCGQVFQ